MKKAFLFLCLFIFLFASNCSLNKDVALESRFNNQEKRIAELEKELERLKEVYSSQFEIQAQELEKMGEFILLLKEQQNKFLTKRTQPFIPEEVTFCEERVPLDRFGIRERLEWALLNEMNRWGICLVFLRSGRWFPMIEKEIKELELPEDLKYVAVVESDLNLEAYSSAGAAGLWQFIRDTAVNLCKLRINMWIDDRLDPEKSTEAALKHLKELYRNPGLGTWVDALASYNMHKDRYKKQKAKERAQDFYDVRDIPLETLRYPFRAIAIKLIMENPEQYSFPPLEEINKIKYEPYPVEAKVITVNYRTEKIVDIAQRFGMTYQEFRSFNPHILIAKNRYKEVIRDYLPRGSYKVYVPKK